MKRKKNYMPLDKFQLKLRTSQIKIEGTGKPETYYFSIILLYFSIVYTNNNKQMMKKYVFELFKKCFSSLVEYFEYHRKNQLQYKKFSSYYILLSLI